MTSEVLDPRLTAARGDLAAASLRGKVVADRYVDGDVFTVFVETLDVKRHPRPDAPLDTQMLFGDILTVYDDDDGWGWAQSERDGYVGYVAISGLWPGRTKATHRVIVPRTFVYPAPDMKRPTLLAVPLDARLAVTSIEGGFARLASHGFVFAAHIAPVETVVADPVAIAERLEGVPYLWGGKSALGIDCSGLVQVSSSMAGRFMPRDTDMQEKLGTALPIDDDLSGLQRGDLVFWRGHVGMMLDNANLLHANAHHMLVSREPLASARDRILQSTGTAISSIRRPPTAAV